jgi:hypothetical protein
MKPMSYVLLLAGALLAPMAAAAPSPTRTAVDAPAGAVLPLFRDDARLRARATLASKDQPLRELLAVLSRETAVPLKAGLGTADEKVTLFLDQRSAAEILSHLARHFSFRWFRLARGYELRQEPDEARREAKLREGELEAEWREVREWTARLERLATTPRAQLEDRAVEIGRRLESPDLIPDERSRLTTEAQAIRDALRPETPPALALLRALTPAQAAQVQRGDNLLLSVEAGTLPARVHARVQETPIPEGARFEDPGELPVWADARIERVEGWHDGGPPRPGDRRTQFSVQVIVRREVEGKPRWTALQWSPLLPPRESAPAAPTETDDPALLRQAELTITKTPRAGAAAVESTATGGDASGWRAWPTLGQVAEALHQATGLEVVADSYVRSRVNPKTIAGRQPLVRLLDAVARDREYTWRKEGSLLLLRSRTYYRDRELEVPDRILRPWQKRAARSEAAPLDELAELAASLNDRQTLGMAMYWAWYLEDPWVAPPVSTPFEFHRLRRHLRFWAALSPAQRQQALSGKPLTVDRMTGEQRRAFLAALTDPVALPWEPAAQILVSRPALTPVDLLSGGFSLKSAEWRLQSFHGEKPGGGATDIVARYPINRPPIISRLPQEYQWSAVGPPTGLSSTTFAYHLSGDEKPARTIEIEVHRPRAAP